MEPLYIILIAIALIIVLLAIFTGVTYLFLSVFRRPAGAKAFKQLSGKRK
ncbi:MAG: hypothetical protein WBZ29_10615 [Methanocella sp.]